MIDDMTLRRLSRETQRNNVRDFRRFAPLLGRSPDTATAYDLRWFPAGCFFGAFRTPAGIRELFAKVERQLRGSQRKYQTFNLLAVSGS
ncbi:hypothetical protein [Mesorhizobium sp. M7D.F.Ca.US.004.03.1.1]|uniref:hypothetical protein n=1 Tax=Mesorhizobium sp. M7D.F.Ca.US.004.03.1.1 TaxID=2496702 RepID=UPI001FE1A97D|nr:hypothetical protein [Mesorhizobium sp. M7D.F.Ca.US.004.03.1.1]